ncbi:MAG: class I SAM-dependent DNA methyltransferase [Paludibacteraceae bacterium]|nr:class I SAM-dependent DNA methyltransferase [Paludibacteraceae bacterium]
MTNTLSQKATRQFAEKWQGKGYEKGDTQKFWLELLQNVLGVQDVFNFIEFEDQVLVENTNFMDGYIPATKVLIEQKSIEKELGKPVVQSDGSLLNPFQQAKKYIVGLPVSKHPRWVVTCNFREIWVYDMEQPNGEPQKILLKNLEKEYYRLQFLVDEGNEHLKREMEVSVKAGELVGVIYDKLLEQYIDKDSPETLRSLNILCVRLVFCLYAEDAGLFPSKTAFHDYLQKYGATDFRRALIDFFVLLDTPIQSRDPYLEDDIAAFPYVNGGLFSDEKIIIPRFTEELKQLLLQNASSDFDWSEISPTIFGAVFESTLNPETRRSGGMHYTSIENIHKVIDPLFMNDLRDEFEGILGTRSSSPAKKLLAAFQDKLASLTFLDPACGSGNFLTETFLSLRRLENEVIQAMYGGNRQIGFEGTIKVNISQFYGIEINDFACTVAKTALWIAESQMLKETSSIVGVDLNFLPLKTNAYIHEGNALRMDWAEIIAPDKLNYIMGNPPFVGYKLLTDNQREDLLAINPNFRSIDYVTGWYYKAAEMMQGTAIKAAFVSTNSISQGSAIQNIWKDLIEKYKININFAWKSFVWNSESNEKAAVHCVIIGFSHCRHTPKLLFENEQHYREVTQINPYLVEADNIIIERRGKQICDMPDMTKGAQLIDGGGFMLETEEEKAEFIKKYPEAAPFIYRYYNAQDFLNAAPAKYCLYLKHCPPQLLHSCQGIREKVKAVYEYRANSSARTTNVLKDTPAQFFQSQVPEHENIVIPVVSSENRRYIPMCFMPAGNVYTNALFYVDNADIYTFGILESNVHMAWMRVVCGRLEMRYRYSNDIVYNNFPFPKPTEEQRKQIEQTAKAILDARAKYPDSSLAALYDELSMPPELRKAHQENDRAVMAAYGFSPKMTESECVAELFKMYQEIVNSKK